MAEYSLPFLFRCRMIPCLPISQSRGYLLGLKFTNRETQTLSFGNSSIVMGSNLSSWSADVKAYFPSIFVKGYGLKVPMHPLNYPLSCQVTKIGQTICLKCSGGEGSFYFFNLASSVSKQKTAIFLVA